MSYDLHFAVRPGGSEPSEQSLRAFFAARPYWTLDEDSAAYRNELTGVHINASFSQRSSDDPADRAPIVIYMSGLRPHCAIYEVADELEAFVRTFNLLVDDAQENGMGRGEFARDALYAGFDTYNRYWHRVNLRSLGQEPPPALPRERVEQVWRWNRKRDELAERSGDELFVPQIFYGLVDGNVRTFIAWADRTAARVPEVDSIQTTRAHVPWSVVAPILQRAPRDGDHWVVDGELLDRVFDAIEAAPAGPPPRIVPPSDVMTREIVDEYALPAEARERRRRCVDLAFQGRIAAHTGRPKEGLAMMVEAAALDPDDYDLHSELAMLAHQHGDCLLAMKMGARAFELRPGVMINALIAAGNAMYAARNEEGLRYADSAIALAPHDRNARLVRSAMLTELARYDEALEAIDAALDLEWDAMGENMRAFTLAAMARDDEAKASYLRALEALDQELEASPDEADLHSRRAYALLGLRRAKEALAAANKALSIKKDEFLTLQSIGRALVALDKPKEAVAALTKAMKQRPAAPMAAFYLAKAYARLGDTAARDRALAGVAPSPHFVRLASSDPELKETAKKKAVAAPKKKAAAPKKKAATAKKKSRR